MQVRAQQPAATKAGIAFAWPAFAFVGSGCLLVLELVAARLIAPTMGVSLYTWTSVIGVVLAGISLGNFLGGRVADRWPSRSTLALIYLAGAGASLLILGVLHFVGSVELPESAPALLQVLWVTAVLFLLPATILGMPTPLLTRLSLHSVEEGGRVVGRIQAAAALGSIVCTFLTGFWLISWFGTRHIVAGVAGVLFLLALLARPPWLRERVAELGSFAVVIVVAGAVSHSGCTRESNYYCIRVASAPALRAPGGDYVRGDFRVLVIDRLVHGVSDLGNPEQLMYGYERLYARAIETLHPRGSPVSALFLGGGAYTFPRWLERSYRGQSLVAEIDPDVTGVAEDDFDAPVGPRIQTVNEDARRVLRSLPAGRRFDFVLGDAFDSFEVPFQLTTRQFHELVARHLKPGGLYLQNVIDGVHYDFLRSELRTLSLTFPYVRLLAARTDWPLPRGRRRAYVIAAALRPPARPLPAEVPEAQLRAFLAHGHSVVLTDDHAPVDQLLAPVFSQALHGG
jgi:predicted membrane-bound spermidine synthase